MRISKYIVVFYNYFKLSSIEELISKLIKIFNYSTSIDSTFIDNPSIMINVP